MPYANYSPHSLYRNITFVLSKIKKTDYDIIHITGTEHYLLPFLNRRKTIITIHDIKSISDSQTGIKGWLKKTIWIKSLYFTNNIVCISDFTYSEIKLQLPKYKKNIHVINNPIQNSFQYRSKEFNDTKPTILHVGTKANKNLINTIKALDGLKCNLVIIGHLNQKQIDCLRESNVCYISKEDISDKELLEEYYNCDVVSFPSFYEGFGMPIIEAQSIGRVVVTSNFSPMKDVAGGAAVLVEPNNIGSIRSGFIEAFENHDLYIGKGLINVRRYNPQIICQEYFHLYEKLI